MNYKETLYFVAKCLTISLENRNKISIEKQLQANNIDWDKVVKISTAHYVFPALYSNLKKSNLLHYLPSELVGYMKNITDLNRERNKQIIKQARELNTFLLANNISPIFLKGTANLLAGIYEDIGDRMVGDIDFILSKDDYSKAIKLIRNFNYSEVEKYDYYIPVRRHYRRLQKENSVAAIEIHLEMVGKERHRNEFNYGHIEKNSQLIDEVRVSSFADMLNLSIISHQINDKGFYYKTMALRNAYDVFLLSKKTDAKDAVNSLDKLTNPLNCFLAACYEIFNNVESLEYNKTKKTSSYLSFFMGQFTNPKKTKIRRKCIKTYLYLKSRLGIINKSLLYKEYRKWLYRKLTDKNWYKEIILRINYKK